VNPSCYVYKIVVGGALWYVGKGSNWSDGDHLRIAEIARTDPAHPSVRPWHVDLGAAIDSGVKVRTLRLSERLTDKQAEDLRNQLIVKLRPLKNQQRVPGLARQSTRLVKLQCPSCGYNVRTTNKWLRVGKPSCCCGAGPLTLVEDRSGHKSTPHH
jgi:hypothetical protein